MISLRGFLIAGTVAVMATATAPALAQSGDPVKGEQVFKKCMTCHRVGDGAKNMVGPVLTGVIGRKSGTIEGFSYSTLNKKAGEAGLVWTEALIFEYLADPNAFLKKFLEGKGIKEASNTKMVLKLPSETERRDVIAYIAKFK